MSDSFTRLYVHLVWTTKLRAPLLTPEIAPRVHGYVAARCRALRCEALAVGGVADHVHALVMLAPDVAVARLVREIKAPTTDFIHREFALTTFAWQSGYGAFSLRDTDLDSLRAYVTRQPLHHADGTTVPTWELTEPPRER